MGRRRLAAAIICSYLTLVCLCEPNFAQQATPPDAAYVAAAELAINEPGLRGHIRFLASDLLEGRGPGSRGDDLAQQYIAAQFESLGLKPILPGNGWFLSVPLVGVTARSSRHGDVSARSTIARAQKARRLRLRRREAAIGSRDRQRRNGVRGLRHRSTRISMGRFQSRRPARQDFADDEQ